MRNDWAILQNRCKIIIDPFKQYSGYVFEIFYITFPQNLMSKLIILFFRILRKLHFIKSIPESLSYNYSWKKNVKKISNWIIFYDSNASSICKFIKKHNPSARVYAYSWDINFVPSSEPCFDDIGTFDPLQAKKNNLSYYSQFFAFSELYTNFLQSAKSNFTFLFCGREKKRKQTILEIKVYCDTIDSNSLWKIVEQSDDSIPYLDYLSLLINSKCIVDIVVDGQSGLTLRPLEALFFDKKLITNNKYLRYMSFYDPANIFIYGIDTNLKQFMDTPLNPVPESIKKQFLLESFVERILSGESVNFAL